MPLRYRRVLLKLSGEMLGTSQDGCIAPSVLMGLAEDLIALQREGVEIGVVVGGGNIWRGAQANWLETSTSHQIGMLATLMNALALRAAVESQGTPGAVISALHIDDCVDGFTAREAVEAMRAGKLVFFAGGTGQPYFTTDTGAVLWALKIQAEVVLKATKVDGVYSADPDTSADAKRYEKLSYAQALREELKVMDLAAFSLCREHRLPIVVFSLRPHGNIRRVVHGEAIGTIVEEENATTDS